MSTQHSNEQIQELLDLSIDSDILITAFSSMNEDNYQVFKSLVTDEKIVFSSNLVHNNFDITEIRRYCDNFELVIQLKILKFLTGLGIQASKKHENLSNNNCITQLALKKFFELQENDRVLREIFSRNCNFWK